MCCYNDNYYIMRRWNKCFALIRNRVGVANEILGCRYHHCRSNPVRLSYSGGTYVVDYGSLGGVTFGVYDLPTIERALDWCNAQNDYLWESRICGSPAFV